MTDDSRMDSMRAEIARLNDLSGRLQDASAQIDAMIASYDLETTAPEALLNLISARQDLIDALKERLEALKTAFRRSDDIVREDMADDLESFRQHFASLLKTIAADDRNSQMRLSDLKSTAAEKLAELMKHRKAMRSYNPHPEPGSTFVDVAVVR